MASFASDIQPLFREKDQKAMTFKFDLHSYDDVKANADDILESVEDGSMPCDDPWDETKVATFRTWISDGFPA